MKHCSSVIRFLLAAVTAFVAWGGEFGVAHAAPTIAVRKCSIFNCDSAMSLKNEARAGAGNLPLGSIMFVSSQQYPLSAFVRICPGPRGAKDACLITSGDLGAIELDNQVYARAAAIEPIDIPIDIARSATQAIPELAEAWIFTARILETTGRTGWSPWHDLFNPLTWPWMEFFDFRTNTFHKVHTKDRITLRFADGSTAQAEMQGLAAASGHFFRFLPESIRLANGQPYVQLPPPLPASPSGSALNLTPPWLNGAFAGTLPFGYCAFLQSHCEFLAGGTQVDCFYRRQEFPCGCRNWCAAFGGGRCGVVCG
jgi:hypothetical protein